MEVKIPLSKFVFKKDGSGYLKEKYMIAEIYCCHQPRQRGYVESFERVKIKITSVSMHDSLLCLYSVENGCEQGRKCVLHCDWGDP
jgi:hypothetical protein